MERLSINIMFVLVIFSTVVYGQVPTVDYVREGTITALTVSNLKVKNIEEDISLSNAALIPLIRKNNSELDEIQDKTQKLMSVYNSINDKVKEIKLVKTIGNNLAIVVNNKYYILTYIMDNSSLYTPEFTVGIKRYMDEHISEQQALYEVLEQIVGDVVKNGLKAAIFKTDDNTRICILKNINSQAKSLNVKGERIKNVLENSAVFLKNNKEYEQTILHSYTNIFSKLIGE
jgi:hypothetical protein